MFLGSGCGYNSKWLCMTWTCWPNLVYSGFCDPPSSHMNWFILLATIKWFNCWRKQLSHGFDSWCEVNNRMCWMVWNVIDGTWIALLTWHILHRFLCLPRLWWHHFVYLWVELLTNNSNWSQTDRAGSQL